MKKILPFIFCLTSFSTIAQNIYVKNSQDGGPGSFRYAVAVAKNGDKIVFEKAYTVVLSSGKLYIYKNLTIDGRGSTIRGASVPIIDAETGKTILLKNFNIVADTKSSLNAILSLIRIATLENCFVIVPEPHSEKTIAVEINRKKLIQLIKENAGGGANNLIAPCDDCDGGGGNTCSNRPPNPSVSVTQPSCGSNNGIITVNSPRESNIEYIMKIQGTTSYFKTYETVFSLTAGHTWEIYSRADEVCWSSSPTVVTINNPPGESTWYHDADGDGYGNPAISTIQCTQPVGYVANNTDCNDNDNTLNPATLWFRDADGDGYGNPNLSTMQCSQPAGYVKDNTDCNDNDNKISPGTLWYADMDGDGYGNANTVAASCTQLLNYVSNNSDCNDNDASVHPKPLYRDADNDGYDGGQETVCYGETVPEGYSLTTLGSDCNDNNPNIHPGATEIRNGIDDDCDLYVDEGTECSAPTYVEANNITGNSAVISWDQAPNAVKYRLSYKSEHQRTWTTIVVTGTSYTLTGLTSNTLYYTAVKSVCANNEISQYVSVTSFTTACSAPQTYCTVSYVSYGDYYIDKVELGTIKNTSGDNQGYGNFTGMSTMLKAGTTARIKLTPGYNSPDKEYDFWVVYIDYNQDGYFRAGDGERVVMGQNPGTTLSRSFNIPGNAKNGCTRMRVIMNYDLNKKPCGYFGVGEVEDYTVNIVGGASAAKAGAIASTTTQPASIPSIKVIPNPINSGNAIAELSMVKEGNATLRISDLSGKILFVKAASNLHAGKNTIDLNDVSKLTNGVYMIVAEQNGIIIGRGQVIVNR